MKYPKSKTVFFLSIASLLHSQIISGQSRLDELAIKFDTDKSSKWHNYTEIYEHYFESKRAHTLNFLEIGFYKGASARMWEAYFPYASLHFIDINAQAFKLHGQNLSSRCHLHIINQSNKSELYNFAKKVGSQFDIIIDDGSHIVGHQIISFVALFPFLKSNGIYIIEDLHTSYWQIYGGGGTMEKPQASPQSAIRFFQALIDDVNYIGARTHCANIKKCPPILLQALNYYQKYIKSMHFYDSLCLIIKR